MRKKRIVAFCVFILASILAILMYFVDGGTINIGTWSETPIEYLKDFAGAGIEYTELKTVYLGENGENGALLLYIERNEETEESNFSIGFFKSKYKAGKYLYSHYSSYSEWTDALTENDVMLKALPDGAQFNCFVALSQLDKSQLYEQFDCFGDALIETVKFELDNSDYSLQYIILQYETKDEAQSFIDFLNQ